MAEKVTVMVLNVDLQCPCYYKKVKKILCKFPQIRDQEYDKKANTVKITVVCCNPEAIRDKLCCKGHKVINSIEIVKPKKVTPPPPTPPPEPPKPVSGCPLVIPVTICCGGPCYHGYGVPPRPCYCGYNVYGGPCHGRRCDCGCFCEENPPQPCSIM